MATNRYFLFVFLLCSGVLRSTCAGEAPTVYTLGDCVRIGLAESGAARNAGHDQEIALTRLRQAYGLALPNLSLRASYTRLDEVQEIEFEGESQEFGNIDNYDVTATVEQLLYSGGQVGAALRAAKAARAYADVARAATEAALIRDVETRFYGILLAREVVAVLAASVDQLQAFVEQTVKRAANGAASEFDELTARVRLANEAPKLIAARNQYELAIAEFVGLLNLPVAGTFTGRLECVDIDLSLDEMQRLALVNRAVLEKSGLRMQLGREEIINARSAGLPDLRAHVNYNGANSYQFVSFDDDWEWHWNAGLVLSWNVWDGNLTRNSVREKESEYDKLVTDDEELLKAVKLEVRQAHLALVHAREAIAASGNSVALAERALAIAKTRHETGLATYLEFTDANLALSTASLARLQAYHDHAVALSAARYACGTNLLGYKNQEDRKREE
jgi:outer membrane protein